MRYTSTEKYEINYCDVESMIGGKTIILAESKEHAIDEFKIKYGNWKIIIAERV